MEKIKSLLGASSTSSSLKGKLANAASALSLGLISKPKETSITDKLMSAIPFFGASSPAQNGNPWTAMLFGNDSSSFTNMLTKLGFSTTLVSVLGSLLYILFQKFISQDPRKSIEILKHGVASIPLLRKVPGLKSLLPTLKQGVAAKLPPSTLKAVQSVHKMNPSWMSYLNPLKWNMFNRKKLKQQKEDEAYQAGESYGDPEVDGASLADDLRAIGLSVGPKALSSLMSAMQNAGGPMDDRQMVMEKLIAIIAALPENSKARKKGTGIVIDALWSSLQHPPMSYLGPKYQYRSADGSYNNPLVPDLGKAGSPYAKTVKKLKHLSGTPPDPGMLFDFLMARTNESFKENPAGISSVLFYHATIIIHDVFCSNRFDNTISDTSSYLDLAPLYGSSREDQLKIRTMSNGMLKPDTFSEKRLLGQPPGVNVMLVMYSRFHNYVADVLLKINEYDRFTLPRTTTDEQKKAALVKQDEDLFQTARLIVGGLYINICLHDYLRGLTNTHHSASSWTLDPRVEVDRLFDKGGVPRGTGNQISAEFNLLYRFHSTISLRDEAWLNEFLKSLFPDLNKPFEQLTPQEFVQGLFRYEQSIPEEPEKREFGGLKRGSDGKFNDAELVKIMKDSMEDPAGLFGARMVPKALRMVEIAGILSSRSWQLASLNECRAFFGLKKHDTFEDINPDPEIADLLRKFYQHPDMVEIYPGLFIEDGKPRMDPGCGGCPPYTVGRAVFSDAVTLVRSDRFLTLDYTTSTLTNWGYQEVQQDLRILGGSMFYKLFHRAFPDWFPYNSLHIMQPMYTRKMNEEIANEIGTIGLYSKADPAPPPRPVVLVELGTIKKVLADQGNFMVPWGRVLADLFPGKHDFSSFMLAGDKPANTAQRNLVGDILYATVDFPKLVCDTTVAVANELLKSKSMTLGKNMIQLDIVRDIAIPVYTRILADIFYLDLITPENPTGSMYHAEMYKHLLNIRTFGFENFDIAMAWKRRMWAQDAATVLIESTTKSIDGLTTVKGIFPATVSAVSNGASKIPIVGKYIGTAAPVTPKAASLRWFGSKLVTEMAASGKPTAEIVDVCWLNAAAGSGVTIAMFSDVLSYFLQPENSQHWSAIIDLAASDNNAADKQIRQYVLEAQRLTSAQRDMRICIADTTVDGFQFKKGDRVVTLIGSAGRNGKSVPDSSTFRLDRPADVYHHFGYGPHKCLGREISLLYVTGLIKVAANLKGLRPAPGAMGALKNIMIGNDKYYLNDSWSYLTSYATTWTMHYESIGRGLYQPTHLDNTEGRNLTELFTSLKEQAKKDASEFSKGVSTDANGLPPSPISEKNEEAATITEGIDGAPKGSNVVRPKAATKVDAGDASGVASPANRVADTPSGDDEHTRPLPTSYTTNGDLTRASSTLRTIIEKVENYDNATAELARNITGATVGNVKDTVESTVDTVRNAADTTIGTARHTTDTAVGIATDIADSTTWTFDHITSSTSSEATDIHPNTAAMITLGAPATANTQRAPPSTPKPDESKGCRRIQQGVVSPASNWGLAKGIKSFDQTITFAQAYAAPPTVVVGVATIDADYSAVRTTPPQVSTEASAVTQTGFTLTVRASTPYTWAFDVSWIAIPSDGEFKNVVSVSFDSRKGGEAHSSPIDTDGSVIAQSFDLSQLNGSSYTEAPYMVTWLSGFQLKGTSFRNAAIRLKCGPVSVETDKAVLGVDVNNAALLRSVQVNVIFIPPHTPLAVNFINPHDAIKFRPATMSTNFKYNPSARGAASRPQQTVAAISGFDFISVGNMSMRAKIAVKKDKDGFVADVGTWSDCRINGVWGWAVSGDA